MENNLTSPIETTHLSNLAEYYLCIVFKAMDISIIFQRIAWRSPLSYTFIRKSHYL